VVVVLAFCFACIWVRERLFRRDGVILVIVLRALIVGVVVTVLRTPCNINETGNSAIFFFLPLCSFHPCLSK